jgi:hypothetical protein
MLPLKGEEGPDYYTTGEEKEEEGLGGEEGVKPNHRKKKN